MAVRKWVPTPAVRKEVPLLIGIMSPSGGGKTKSALRLATGIQSVYGGEIFGIDTENNRMLHYADKHKFQHVPFAPPFGSLDYLEACRQVSGFGSRITIVDSMTHEHIGEGGYLETAEKKVSLVAGNDYKKREACKMLGWAEAGPKRQQMIEGLKQLPGVFIFCFRAKEKAKPGGRGEGVIDLGFMPVAGEEWVYEMSVNLMLLPRSNGVPSWRSDYIGERMMMKLPEQFKGIFQKERPLDEDIGRELALWAKGGAAPPLTSDFDADGDMPTSDQAFAAEQALTAAAAKGWDALRVEWEKLSPPLQDILRGGLNDRHKLRAREADANREHGVVE